VGKVKRAAELRRRGIDVEKLRQYVHDHPELKTHLLNSRKRKEILESIPGCIPESFAEEAYDFALYDAGLAAFQLVDTPINGDERRASLFSEISFTETVKNEDGSEQQIRVTGLKHILGMAPDEFDESERQAAGRIRSQGRALNAKRIVRNRFADSNGWPWGELPFPEFEENGDSSGGEDGFSQAGH
jgi:hypothetical protein